MIDRFRRRQRGRENYSANEKEYWSNIIVLVTQNLREMILIERYKSRVKRQWVMRDRQIDR